jgi:putative tryptophan/tyrosine transport system substrate-binding protein
VIGNQLSVNRKSRTRILLSYCLLITVLLITGLARAQQSSAKVPRIGYISGRDASSPGPLVAAFQKGLRELGYVEGKNIVVEYRFSGAQIEVFPRLLSELVDRNVDVLVVPIQPATAKRLVKTIPIVIISNVDPVASGLIDSLAHPGGNLTGCTTASRELGGKRLDLLKEVVPQLTRVGILRNTDEPSTSFTTMKEFEAAARGLKLDLQPLDVQGTKPDLEGAFKVASKASVNAVMVLTPALIGEQKRIAELAIKQRLPTIFEGPTWVEAGGLMSYSADEADMFRRAARYVDKILKGAKPADLPVEQPTKFELVINLKTAKQIGVTIPQSVLYQADRVIK